MGKSLPDWLRNLHAGQPQRLHAIERLAALPPAYPLAFALAVSHTDASAHEGLLADAFGWAENMVQRPH